MKRALFIIFIFFNVIAHSQTKRVLFIGNSYTWVNNMPQIVKNLAGSVGDNLTFEASAISSYSFFEHSTNISTLNLIRQGGWEYVVLQEYSQNPSNPLPWVQENVYPYAQFLNSEINTYSPNAETIFYMTWGRRDGDDGRCPYIPEVCTYEGMDDLTSERYMYMAEAYHAIVSPVGAVWRYLRENHPSIELYDPDGSHPTAAGSYAAACSFYTAIFRKDPSLLTYNFTLNASDAQIIREAAKMVVFNNLLTWHIGEYDQDMQAPTAPTGLNATNITETSFTLTWSASSDNIAVTGYEVYRNGALLTTVTSTSEYISGLSPSTSYSITLKAKDAAGNVSPESITLIVTTSSLSSILTVTGVTANNRGYNGTTLATLNTESATLLGVLGDDDVVLVTSGATGTFMNKSVGNAKTVIISGFILSGPDAGKYTLNQPTTTADINQAGLTISGITAINKVYNGTTLANLNTGSATISGVLGGDIVNFITSGATGTFENKNVGTTKEVTIHGLTLNGIDASNYILTQPSSAADITAAGLNVSGLTADNKEYDGTTSATLNFGGTFLSGVFGTDVVSLNSIGAIGSFSDANVGSSKLVTTSGFTLEGTDSDNYTLVQPTITASITGIELTLTGVIASDKVYNGTTTAALNMENATLVGVRALDVVTVITSGATGTFNNKNVGSAKIITISGITLGGANAENYILIQPSTTANITSATLTISGVSANNKVYDGTTPTSLNTGSAMLTGKFGSDVVNPVFSETTGTFVNKNVGTGKMVTISGITLSGTDAGNYFLTQPSSTANITAAILNVSGLTVNNKEYDGTTSATLNIGGTFLTGVFGTDIVVLNSTGAIGTFENANVGTSKLVTISGFTFGGSDSGNYILEQPTTTASITGIVLTLTGVIASDKVYNGTTTAALNSENATLVGVKAGDAVSVITSGAIGTFVNKNTGTAKVVTISGIILGGSEAGNYVLTQPTTTANITPATLAISGVTANNKVYNGTNVATLNTGSAVLTGKFGSDAVIPDFSGTIGTFINKNVGTGKLVTISGITLSGTDAENYFLTQPSSTANITFAGLFVSGVTANNKVYDGTTLATLNTGNATLTGVLGTDVVILIKAGASGAFVNADAGTSKIVTTSGFTIGGFDSGNYTLVQPNTTASITGIVLTITGVTASDRIYNGTTTATISAENATLVGVRAGDIVAVITSVATGTFNNKNVGTAKQVTISGITLGGPNAENYLLTQPATTATITGSLIKVSGVTVINKVYDGTTEAVLNTENAVLTGKFDSDVVSPVFSGAKGTFADKNVGTGKRVTISGITLSGNDANNYILSQPTSTASITTKAVTVIANNLLKPFRTTLIFTGSEFTAVGIATGDNIPVMTIASPGAIASANVGPYPISIGGGVDNNYNYTYISGILTVNKAVLVANADDKTKFYGSENPTLSISYSGFINNEDTSVIEKLPVASTSAMISSIPGIYSITLSGGYDNNYDLRFVDGTLKIEKAPLIITAENKVKVYKDINPTLSLTYSGFVLDQDLRILDNLPVVETASDIDSDAGVYEINVLGASARNYDITYKKGTLTINKADQEITFAKIPDGLRVTQKYEMNGVASSGLEVKFVASDPKIKILNGNILSVERDGKTRIAAQQPGNKNWNPAPDVTQSIATLPTFDNISSLFTPNSDGMNDFWYIPELEQYGKAEVTVYNRFGQSVYQSQNYNNDWDGTYNGNPLPAASYYYIIKSLNNGLIKGVVNIIR